MARDAEDNERDKQQSRQNHELLEGTCGSQLSEDILVVTDVDHDPARQSTDGLIEHMEPLTLVVGHRDIAVLTKLVVLGRLNKSLVFGMVGSQF